jgi:transposase
MVRLPAEPELHRVHPQAAGIDIRASEHCLVAVVWAGNPPTLRRWVSIPSELDPEAVRKFSCFTADLYAMAEWLKSRGITTVAMESTGVYWSPLFQITA